MAAPSMRVKKSLKNPFSKQIFVFHYRFNNLFILILCIGNVRGNVRENAYSGETIMARLPDTENEQSKVKTVLQAIGNSRRLRILNELADGGERSVSELEAIISNPSQSALSQHRSRLRLANIVRTRCES